jgi:hypothetical protein
MKSILYNPYRTVGLLVGATAREQTQQINRLKKYIDADQDPQDDFSFTKLGNFSRTLDSVEEAVSKLNLDTDKINAALFWFWNGNPITDESAFDALKDGDVEIAFKIWDKVVSEIKEDGGSAWKTVTSKNYTAFHNFFIASFFKESPNFSDAIVAQMKFLESDFALDFVSKVADSTYKTNKRGLQLLFLNQLHSDIQVSELSLLPKFIDILNKLEFVAKQDFMNGFVQKPIEEIEKKIEKAKNKRKANKANAVKTGQELIKSTSSDLAQLKSIVGVNDLKYTSIADKVANEILQCSIDFFNDSNEDDSNTDYAEIAIKLAQQAENIAVGNLTKDRVKDNINTIAEMKDKEISKAIQILKSIKEAYEESKTKITAEVRSMTLGNNQTINWSKVSEAIENSLDWDKVVSLIQEVIPQKNVEKIKNINNASQINEYKGLVDFVLGKLNYSRKNKIKYICYWKTVSSSSPTSSSQSDFDFAENAWWILGLIGLAIGAAAGELGLAVVGALIGAGIGSKFK